MRGRGCRLPLRCVRAWHTGVACVRARGVQAESLLEKAAASEVATAGEKKAIAAFGAKIKKVRAKERAKRKAMAKAMFGGS